jgi:glutamine amidotransferase PdxT
VRVIRVLSAHGSVEKHVTWKRLNVKAAIVAVARSLRLRKFNGLLMSGAQPGKRRWRPVARSVRHG